MEYSPEFIHLLLLIAIPVGMVCCFLGYKAFKFVFGLLGFVGGLIVGSTLAVSFNIEGVVMWIIVIAGGILGAGLSVGLYFFGIFVAGAVSGGLLGSLLSGQFTIEPLILILALGLVCGVAALIIQKPIIVVSTALVGAWLAVSGGAYFLGEFDAFNFFQNPSSALKEYEGKELLLIGWLILSGLGMLVQFRSRARSKKRSKEQNE